jgi:hypothetical protein
MSPLLFHPRLYLVTAIAAQASPQWAARNPYGRAYTENPDNTSGATGLIDGTSDRADASRVAATRSQLSNKFIKIYGFIAMLPKRWLYAAAVTT